MDEFDVLTAAEARITTPNPKYVDLVAEVTRFRLVDKTAPFGGPSWFDAMRRFRDVADRLMGLADFEAGVDAKVAEFERPCGHRPADACDACVPGGA